MGAAAGVLLRLGSANRLEWLAGNADRKELGLTRKFGDDALAYFTERVDPEVIRQRAAETLKLIKANKVLAQEFESAFRRGALPWSGH